VSGRLGLSALGLRLLKTRSRPKTTEETTAIQAHLYPKPQCALGRFLSEARVASALMDLSDGLSTDLARLCEASGVGAKLFQDQIPTPKVADSRLALKLALHGGEDYQLLFTVPPDDTARLLSHWRGVSLHQIGVIERSTGLRLIRSDGKETPLRPAGWDHFQRK
jgi:thiamine-monophosphate kinase